MGNWLRSVQAARMLGVSRECITAMIKSRRLMGRYHSGYWLVFRPHIDCILAGHMLLEKGIFWKNGETK